MAPAWQPPPPPTTVPSSWPRTPNPESENDIAHFVPLSIQTVGILGTFPLHISADAAFDAWYVYQGCACRGGMAAILRNQHAHPVGCSAMPMAPRAARQAYACTRPTNSGIPMATAPNATAVHSCIQLGLERAVSMNNRPLARAASRTSTSRRAD